MALSIDVRAVFIGLAALAFALQDAPATKTADLAGLLHVGGSIQPCALSAPVVRTGADVDVTGSIAPPETAAECR